MFKKKASQILLDYVDGKGRGDEVDDLVHRRMDGIEEIEIAGPLLEISKIFSTDRYLIGISNPESFSAIKELASRLREKGM